MSKDTELYELCKEVYKRTKWDDYCEYWSFGGEYTVDKDSMTSIEVQTAIIPLYTSDYLLEKLPVHLKEGTLSSLYELDEDNRPWCWGYHYDDRRVQLPNGHYAQGWHDTPLKALLKLTIALSEAGVKL